MQNIKSISSLFLLILVLFVTGCQSKFKYPIKKTDNKVTIYQDSIIISIEIINESIIHIHKIKEGSKVTNIPDYVTILEPQNVSWKLIENEDNSTISTSKLNVIVHSNGLIEYKTKDEKTLVSETRELSYIKPDNSDENNVSQGFVAGDEALYGLGQFQSGIMNWKNVPIRLQQYNQEIAIPFLVSTKGYGIYWHNYSLTDINEPQNEILFGQTANISNQKKNEAVVETEEKENVAAYITTQKADKNTRIVKFIPDQTGEYTFLALSDTSGRMRGEIHVIIDGDAIINYSTIWMPRRYSGKKYLEAGKEYQIEYKNTRAKIPGKLFYNKPDYNKTVFSSATGNAIDYYIVEGGNPGEVIAEFQNLTGKAPMFSKGSYGFWQCRERYHNQAELLENAREMRKREVPVDNIVQDWFYWPKKTKGPEWDRKKYPDAQAMVDELKELNMKLMVSVWPEVKNDPLVKKYSLKKIESSNYVDIYDKENSKRFYKMLSDSMFHIGVSSIWLDGTEPEGVKDTKVTTAVGPYEDVHNVYSLEVTRAMYEGRRIEFPKERVFNLTRSAYAGQQRYGATSWSGDVEASWEQFSEQIAAGLNFTMTGLPYWSHDIGGFFRDSKSINSEFDSQYTNPEYIELLTRWFQFGAFSPIFRIHGYVSETEIWRYNEAFESTARKFIDLRYQLMPYIYSQAWQVTKNSRQLMSPIAYHYPTDKNTWGIKDQLFFGESIMVGFVTEYKQREKEIYFPKGEWFNYWTNDKIVGGKKIAVKAELNEIPMFIKAGSILPIGPKVQFATQKTDMPMRLKVYPGADTEYTLYFDDTESYAYENGMFSEVKITYSEKNKELIFTKGNGEYINFEQTPMEFIVELVGVDSIHDVTFNGIQLTLDF